MRYEARKNKSLVYRNAYEILFWKTARKHKTFYDF